MNVTSTAFASLYGESFNMILKFPFASGVVGELSLHAARVAAEMKTPASK